MNGLVGGKNLIPCLAFMNKKNLQKMIIYYNINQTIYHQTSFAVKLYLFGQKPRQGSA